MSHLPPLRLIGADVLIDSELRREAISVEADRFSDAALREVDLSGYLLLPGIVDLHGTRFERHIRAFHRAARPIAPGFRATEREAAANGITTAWLAQSWSWEGGLHGPDFAELVMEDFAGWRPGALIDMRLQLRLETHMIETRERLLRAVARHGVDYVVFNNHLPEALRMAKTSPPAFAALADRNATVVEALRSRVNAARDEAAAVPRHLLNLVKAFDELDVTYASHDDPDADTRERYRVLGARIAEFPKTSKAAAAAKAMGDPVVMGAPNVLRGGSKSDGVSAAMLIARNRCDALVSEDHYPSLAQAAWSLADAGARPFPRAWEMISRVPACILGLHDRGRIAAGQRADFVLVNAESRDIEATISAGRIAHLSGGLAARLIGAARLAKMAAE